MAMADKFDELMKELHLLKKEMELQRLREVEECTIFIKIHFEIYPISCGILGQMFSGVVVDNIDRFGEGDQFHSRIRFPIRGLAAEALKWFNGRCIYQGCCQLELFLESTLRAHSSSNLGEDGVVEEMAAPNQGVAEDSVEVLQSSDETKNHDKLVESLRILGQRHQLLERANRTILIKIRFELYPVSGEVLDRIFSGIGNLETIEIFDQGNPFHSRICFEDQDSALRAIDCCNGMFIYDGCFCQMELSLYVSDKLSEMEVKDTNVHSSTDLQIQPDQFSETLAKDNIQGSCEFVEIEAQEIDDDPEGFQIQNESSLVDDLQKLREGNEALDQVIDENPWQPQFELSKVIFDSQSTAKIDISLLDRMESDGNLVNINLMGKEIELRMSSVEFTEIASAQKVFVKMSRQGELSIATAAEIVKHRGLDMNSVFDPGIAEFSVEDSYSNPTAVCDGINSQVIDLLRRLNLVPFDRGKAALFPCMSEVPTDSCIEELANMILVFDPGGIHSLMGRNQGRSGILGNEFGVAELIKSYRVLGCILDFDPGWDLFSGVEPGFVVKSMLESYG